MMLNIKNCMYTCVYVQNKEIIIQQRKSKKEKCKL